MSFQYPIWLLVGIIACILMFLQFRSITARRQATLTRFVAPSLIGSLTASISLPKRRAKQLLVMLAVMLLFTALARPQLGYEWIDVKRKGIDLLFALDTSKSMLAEDIRPNRLKRASLAILDFVGKLEGDRAGLMPFAGSAYLMCPLTTDYEAFEQSLQAVNTDIIPTGGTNLGEVINNADKLLSTSANHKILIILTDGENLQGDAIAAAEKAKTSGLTVYTVGVGTAAGELIPLSDNGRQGFVKDAQGNFVTSKLDDATLTTIAEKTGGLYVPLGNSGQGLETIYQQKLALIPKEQLAERRHKVPIDRFEWPLGAALLLLAIEILIGERKNGTKGYRKNGKKFWLKNAKAAGLIATTMLAMQLQTPNSYASPGEKAYNEGNYLEASKYYSQQLEKNPDDPQLNYNFGTAAYRNNMYDDAANAFTKALKSDDPQLQQKSYFNLGNSHFQKGLETVQANPQETIKEWEQAIKAYDASVKLAPANDAAKQNKEMVEKQLEELKKQQPPPQQNQQNQDQQQQDQDKNQDQKDKQDGGQQQGSSGDQKQNGGQNQQDQQGNQDKQHNPENGQKDEGSQKDNTDGASTQQDQAVQQQAGKESDKDKDPALTDEGEQKQEKGEIAEASSPSPEDGDKQAPAVKAEPGQMSKDEAEQLLRSIISEEGNLNFVPKAKNDHVEKDW